MGPLDQYVGQVLDDKYRLERLLGQGGMGAVYLATHLGTERYVALKLIAPQFMRNEEFVQRFQREARAAGRLRHPNVVDVTDFGFASAGKEPVAYLVMEYLDGCTLGDVLKEEKRLPLEWVVDILEQVCSAVHEAHQQGIVHRDLKPENIWLEPNRLGSYRVKVLDFGIAKLAGGDSAEGIHTSQVQAAPAISSPKPRLNSHQLEIDTLIRRDDENIPSPEEPEKPGTTVTPRLLDGEDTKILAPTLVASDAAATALFAHAPPADEDNGRTRRFDHATRHAASAGKSTIAPGAHGTELTRVGAIMGTPLYMSPEQCAAKNLDARSDIYSLGVIAYQMIAGDPPFAGDTAAIMRGHLETAPPDLRERAKKVPKRVAKVVTSALSKDPGERPQTAAALATSLRAQAESLGSLYRRAVALYSEYFPKFVRLSLIAHIPVIVTTFLLIGAEIAEKYLPKGGMFQKVSLIVVVVILALLQVAAYFVAASAISGMTAVIVTQLSVAPLRPVELRTPFALLKRRWKPFLKTSIRVTLRVLVGYLLCIIPGFIMSVRYALYAPVVLIEGLEKKAAMRRARELASRSWRTVVIVSLLQFLIPLVVSAMLGGLSWSMHSKKSFWSQIFQQLKGLANILIIPLMSIVPALLYLKMRQLGGETLNDLLQQIEEVDSQRSEWQQRMRTRLSTNTGRTSRQFSDAGASRQGQAAGRGGDSSS
jgi:serine/threonine protein kinase